jgi:hypothetical protein
MGKLRDVEKLGFPMLATQAQHPRHAAPSGHFWILVGGWGLASFVEGWLQGILRASPLMMPKDS